MMETELKPDQVTENPLEEFGNFQIESSGPKPPKRIIQRPLVSVIIPTYNMEKFIIKAIESVKAQTYENIEIIIVDDGSTDNTLEILKAKYEGHIKNMTILQKKNGGTGSALNIGINFARGEWIKWLSADDELYPHAITDLVMLGVEDQGARGQNAIFYTDYNIIDENGNQIGEFREPGRLFTDQKAIVDEMFEHFFGNGSTSLIHKNVFKKCGLFDESLAHSEDYEFWLRAVTLYNISMIHIPIKSLKYRSHLGQLTNRIGGQLDDFIKQSVREKFGKRQSLLTPNSEKLIMSNSELSFECLGCLKKVEATCNLGCCQTCHREGKCDHTKDKGV